MIGNDSFEAITGTQIHTTPESAFSHFKSKLDSLLPSIKKVDTEQMMPEIFKYPEPSIDELYVQG